jgi:hypothetical protein
MEWTPRHRTTTRTESLVHKLRELAREIDETLLAAASLDARGEWRTLRASWPSASAVRSGVIDLSDDELDAMIDKVKRFKSILDRLAGAPAALARQPRALALVA